MCVVYVGPSNRGRFFLAFMIRCSCFSVALSQSFCLYKVELCERESERRDRTNEREKIPPIPKLENGNPLISAFLDTDFCIIYIIIHNIRG